MDAGSETGSRQEMCGSGPGALPGSRRRLWGHPAPEQLPELQETAKGLCVPAAGGALRRTLSPKEPRR